MNRKEFGELVATLRQDLGWTQFQLAEYAGLDAAVISQIERGVKKFFEPELLLSLANAFQLTTLERREFVLASTGLEQSQIVRPPSAAMAVDDAEMALARMISLTGEIRLPAFLGDVYGDVVAANHIMMAFYDVPPDMIASAASLPGGYNTVRLNFGHELVGRKRILDNWDAYALNSMHSFRENSLRYRAKPYFKYLMHAFRDHSKYPFFDRYWKMVSSTERDKDANLDVFSYEHHRFGPLKYVASITIAVTSFGNLYLVQNLPLDEQTENVFDQLKKKAGFGVRRFAPWPEKNMP